MRQAINESRRRRKIQLQYNEVHKITPKTVVKKLKEGIEVYFREQENLKRRLDLEDKDLEIMEAISYLEKEMQIAAKNLLFEKAASLRDKIKELQEVLKREVPTSPLKKNSHRSRLRRAGRTEQVGKKKILKKKK